MSYGYLKVNDHHGDNDNCIDNGIDNDIDNDVDIDTYVCNPVCRARAGVFPVLRVHVRVPVRSVSSLAGRRSHKCYGSHDADVMGSPGHLPPDHNHPPTHCARIRDSTVR